jgi:alpha-ketoglutarate-dependent taurine dioxygenase
LKDGIYTSTEAPPGVKIPLHNELSFVNKYPSHIYFFCQIAPEKDGETILGDSRQILKAINPEVRNRFIERRLKYVSAYYHRSPLMEFINKIQPSHKSWINVFETENKSEVERLCRENSFSKWGPCDWIQISQHRPAVINHPISQEEVWFNQAHLYDFNPKLLGWWRYLGAQLLYCRKHTKFHEIFHEDGSKVARSDLYHIMDVLDAQTLYFPWQQGDVLVLDNVLSMHGRATYKGKRRVLAAMTG